MTGDGDRGFIDGYAILATHTAMAVCYLRDLRALEQGA